MDDTIVLLLNFCVRGGHVGFGIRAEQGMAGLCKRVIVVLGVSTLVCVLQIKEMTLIGIILIIVAAALWIKYGSDGDED